MLNKQQEKILKHLLSLERTAQNSVAIGNQMSTYPKNIEDKKLIQILDSLEKSKLIEIKWRSVHHDNLDYAINISILPEADSYFKQKKISKRSSRREWIRTYIPPILSVISIILSIIALIVSICF